MITVLFLAIVVLSSFVICLTYAFWGLERVLDATLDGCIEMAKRIEFLEKDYERRQAGK